jgi:hypothetical protein
VISPSPGGGVQPHSPLRSSRQAFAVQTALSAPRPADSSSWESCGKRSRAHADHLQRREHANMQRQCFQHAAAPHRETRRVHRDRPRSRRSLDRSGRAAQSSKGLWTVVEGRTWKGRRRGARVPQHPSCSVAQATVPTTVLTTPSPRGRPIISRPHTGQQTKRAAVMRHGGRRAWANRNAWPPAVSGVCRGSWGAHGGLTAGRYNARSQNANARGTARRRTGAATEAGSRYLGEPRQCAVLGCACRAESGEPRRRRRLSALLALLARPPVPRRASLCLALPRRPPPALASGSLPLGPTGPCRRPSLVCTMWASFCRRRRGPRRKYKTPPPCHRPLRQMSSALSSSPPRPSPIPET